MESKANKKSLRILMALVVTFGCTTTVAENIRFCDAVMNSNGQ